MFLVGFLTAKVLPYLYVWFYTRRLKKTYYTARNEARKKWESNKEKGDFPKWEQVIISGKTVNVDKNTGYCPQYDSYLTDEYLDAESKARKMEDEYKVYRDEEFAKIAERYHIEPIQIEKIYDDLISVKPNFVKNKMTELIKEVKDAKNN